MTKAEFLKLPMDQRRKILKQQAESVADIYNTPPGLCPDPIPDHIQEELTTLRERVRSLEDEVKRGMEWADKVEKLRLETANNLTKSIENTNEKEVTIALLRLTVNQLKSRIHELEEALIKASKTFPNPELKEQADRIKELEEAMPKPEALRQMADEFDDGYFTFAAPFRRMADRIEKVMKADRK